MKEYYKTNRGILYQGSAMEVLPELAEQSVHCVITSPPYCGLRKYGAGGECEFVWGGDAECEHKWGKETNIATGRNDSTWGATKDNQEVRCPKQYATSGQFCAKCGAWRGQLGLEPTPERYIQNMVEIFRLVRRVLRDDGVIFLNMGDSYNTSGGTGQNRYFDGRENIFGAGNRPKNDPRCQKTEGLKPLDKCLIPHRLAIALQSDGWFVRQDIVWAKPNPMPESVGGWRWERCRVKVGNKGRATETQRQITGQQDHNSDGSFKQDAVWQDCPGCSKCEKNGGLVLRKGNWRPTTAHEFVFMLTKTKSYYCDAESVREKCSLTSHGSPNIIPGWKNEILGQGKGNLGKWTEEQKATGRNLRSVWHLATQPFSDAHFATFPEELVRKPLFVSTSERGCCPTCGKQFARVVAPKTYTPTRTGVNTGKGKSGTDIDPNANLHKSDLSKYRMQISTNTIGWRPACDCKIFTCNNCSSVIDFNDNTVEVKKNGQKRRTSKIWNGVHLPDVSKKISEPNQKFKVLQQDLCGIMDEQSSIQSGSLDHNEGICPYPHTKTSNVNKGGICYGTSSCNGEAYRQNAPKGRSHSPYQRNKGRQQNRESCSLQENGARQVAQAKESQNNKLSSLRKRNNSSVECPLCGGPTTSSPLKPEPCLVLDPFAGAGTVGLVAQTHGRNFILIEPVLEYCEIIKKRIEASADMFS